MPEDLNKFVNQPSQTSLSVKAETGLRDLHSESFDLAGDELPGASLENRSLAAMTEVDSDQEKKEEKSPVNLKEVYKKIISGEIEDGIDYLMEQGVKIDKVLANALFSMGKGNFIVRNMHRFEDLDEVYRLEIIQSVIDNGYARVVLSSLDKNLDLQDKILIKVFEAGEEEAITADYSLTRKFANNNVALLLLKYEKTDMLLDALNCFHDLSNEVLFKLIESGGTYEVLNNLNVFNDLNKKVAFRLIKEGEGAQVVVNNYKFKNFLLDNEAALALVLNERDAVTDSHALYYFSYFSNLSNEVALALSKRGFFSVISRYRRNFPADFFQLVIESLKKEKDEKTLSLFYLSFGEKEDWKDLLGDEEVRTFLNVLPKGKLIDEKRNAFTHNKYDRTSELLESLCQNDLFLINTKDLSIAKKYIEKYGLAKQNKLYEYFKNLQLLKTGDIKGLPPKQIEEGVSSFEILEEKYKKLQTLVFSGKEILAEDLDGFASLEIELLDQITGKSSHRFNEGRPSLESIVGDFKNYSKKEEKDLISKKYKEINIKSSADSYIFDGDKLKKENSYYSILKTELLAIFDTDKDDKVKIEILLSSIKEKIEQKRNALKDKADKPYIQSQLIKYEALSKSLVIDDESKHPYDDLLKQLLAVDRKIIETSALSSEIRQIVFRKVLEIGDNREQLLNVLSEKEPSGEALFLLLDLVKNIIKKDVLDFQGEKVEDYWTSEMKNLIIKANNKKSGLFNVSKVFNSFLKDLKQEVDSLKRIETGREDLLIDCFPDRGFIGEMSAYLANVCYSKEYPLLERHSNVIPYKFIDNTDLENKRFLGSVLLFELESKKGEKVVLLRAFNIPKENEVDISKFIEDFINKIGPTLKARGIKKILVPGESGAISNYPITNYHMHKNYIDDKEPISLSDEFNFNRHNLTNNCFVVKEL